MLEVDTRKVEGTADAVSLVLVAPNGAAAVLVFDADGNEVSRETFEDRSEALEHYRHPFAYIGGPQIPSDVETFEEPPATTEAAIARMGS